MRLRVVLPFLAAVLAGCSGGGGITAAGSCTYVARVGDVDYAAWGEVGADKVGPEFTRTTRQRDCEDVIIYGQPGPEPWKSGDSSFPAGTALYASKDYPTSTVLLVAWGDGRYMQLHTLPQPGSPASPQ